MILIHLFFTISVSFACPTIEGTYSCTSTKGETDKVQIRTFQVQGITNYTIHNENALKALQLTADGEYRVEQEVITDDHGKVIGTIVTQKKSICTTNKQLQFERRSDVTYYGQKLKQQLFSKLTKHSNHQLETTTQIIKINAKGKKSITTSNSFCVKN